MMHDAHNFKFYQMLPECHKNKNLKPQGDKASGFIIAADGIYMRTTISFIRTAFVLTI